MKCPICGKDYVNYGWFRHHMTKVHNWSDEDCTGYWDYHCPFCGANIPEHIITCWGCGACLDPHLVELAEEKKRNE